MFIFLMFSIKECSRYFPSFELRKEKIRKKKTSEITEFKIFLGEFESRTEIFLNFGLDHLKTPSAYKITEVFVITK